MADFNYQLLMLYLGLFLSGIIMINVMMQGFILQWWKVKKSKGKLMLIKVRHSVTNYWKAGSIEKGFIQYTARKRRDNPDPKRMISVSDEILKLAVHRDWGVSWIEVDDEKECVFYLDNNSYKSVTGANTEKVDSIIQTALNKPSKFDGLLDPRTFQIVVLLAFVILIIGMYLTFKTVGQVDDHVKLVYDTVQPMHDLMFNATFKP